MTMRYCPRIKRLCEHSRAKWKSDDFICEKAGKPTAELSECPEGKKEEGKGNVSG